MASLLLRCPASAIVEALQEAGSLKDKVVEDELKKVGANYIQAGPCRVFAVQGIRI
jgi:hypothetical protein